MDWKENFPARLQALREARGWSKAELGRQVGVTKVTILEYENGRKTPGIDTLVALATVFDCTLDALLGRDHPASPPS